MANQNESVQIFIKSIGRAIHFPVKSSETCKKCKGTGKGQKNGRCPNCNGSGQIKMLDCVCCSGNKVTSDGTTCKVCKGEGTLTEVKTREFLEAREFCENFRKNPAKTILICFACLVALGVCSHIITGYAFVDFRLIKTWPSYISLLVGIGAGFYVLVCVNKMNKGSYHTAATKTLISAGVIAVWIATVAIPGPIMGRYNWIERQSKEIVSDGVSSQGLSCEKVKVFSNDGNLYHGMAALSNGEKIEVNIHYQEVRSYNRKITYSIHVEPVNRSNDSTDEE